MADNKYAIFRGNIVPIEQAQLSIMSHVVNYGTGAFGGIRGYWNESAQQLYIFRLEDHLHRILQSGRLLMMNLPYTVPQLKEQILELIRKEGYKQDIYLRPLVFKSDCIIGVKLHGLTDEFSCFAVPFGRYIDKEEGLRAHVSSWRRIDDNVIPARGKIVGSYVNSAFSKSEAVLNGFDEAIVLNDSGHVAEGSAENIFVIRNGQVFTPPLNDNILEGITRRTVMQLFREVFHLQVIERSIDRSELYVADEAFFCGTGCQIAAIAEIDRRPVGTGKMGELVRKLRDLYFSIVRGERAEYLGWCTAVYPDSAA